MTPDRMTPEQLAAWAFASANLPASAGASTPRPRCCPCINTMREQKLAQYLSVIDGQVVVTGGEIAGGSHWHLVPGDGSPRFTDDLLGTGIPLPYPITRLVDDLRLADRDFDW